MKSAILATVAGLMLAAAAVPAAAQAAGDVAAAVKAGATVSDAKGGSVGTIDSVANNVAVVNTGTVKVGLPLASFAVGQNGPVIGMTKTELEAAAASAQQKTAASIAPGAQVFGSQGASIGTIESVDSGFAVVATANSKVKLPVSSFATGASGLVIGMTAAELDAAAKAASPAPAAQ